MAESDDILEEAKDAFQRVASFEEHNRIVAKDDIRFSRLDDQWPDKVKQQRQLESRPCLTINKLQAFTRQVVNDSRQNKPSIKVHPVDSQADVATADIINGLIRNIEYTSNADVAYDTAVEQSVSGGFGYWRVTLDYAYDDTFDQDLMIKRVSNQFSVYGDPDSTAADSSDWNSAFIVDRIGKKQFDRKYKGTKNADGKPVAVDFDSDAWNNTENWIDDEFVMIGEWWKREQVEKTITLVSDGQNQQVMDEEMLAMREIQALISAGILQFMQERKALSHKVTQYVMTGADILEKTDWKGCYIPIIPVYGDEIILEGKRYLRSLIHSAKDAQMMYNFWRTNATELVALAPRVPFIGPKGAFDSDIDNWATVNSKSHAFLEYDGAQPPQRQPLDVGPAAGALQEALNASDDMKAIIGMYDASLGARSNETSGRAIMARQREGDVATFHFIDNLARSIRHTGRILIDLIPKVYTTERIVRVIGEDGVQRAVTINSREPKPQMAQDGKPAMDNDGNPVAGVYNLTAGKYDLTVTTGPSFTSRREEAAYQMTEFIRAYPASAPVIGDIVAKNLDWPGADEIADRLKSINPALQKQQIPPELQQMIQMGQQQIQELTQKVQALEADKSIDQFNADTERMKVEGDIVNDREKIKLEAQTKVAGHVISAQQKANQANMNPTRQG
ncbi:MAG: portal protein [Pararhizobium sp.]